MTAAARKLLRAVLLAICVAARAASQGAGADPPPAAELVCSQQGGLPILITAPHGGKIEIVGVPPRSPKPGARVNTVPDENTAEIAEIVNVELQRLLGKKPFVVIARFHRRSLDANRAAETGFQSPLAKPYYHAYHGRVREFVDVIRREWGSGLLVDLHGQRLMPDTIMRGTRDGKTCGRLLDRSGWQALVGPQSVLGSLAGSKYKVFPTTAEGKEGTWTHIGSYTVATYGGADGLDAIQLEIGRSLRRDKDAYTKLSLDLAKAISVFYESYLKTPSGPEARRLCFSISQAENVRVGRN